jgi:predicted DNA binding protein
MRIATLLLKIPGNWIGDLSQSCQMSIKVMKCVPTDDNGAKSLLRIDTEADLANSRVEEMIRSIEPFCNVQLAKAGPGRLLGTIELEACRACAIVSETGCILDSARSRPDGRIQWSIIAPDAARLTMLVDRLRQVGVTVVLEKVSVLRTAKELTREQERVIELAYELGYFDIPKKIKLEELAKRLGISKATLDVMLRRAQRKILASHLGQQ